MSFKGLPPELRLLIAECLPDLQEFGRIDRECHVMAANVSLARATSGSVRMRSTDFFWFIPILAKERPHISVNRFAVEIVVRETKAFESHASQVGRDLLLFERISQQTTFCEIPSEKVSRLIQSVRARLEEDNKVIKAKHLTRSILLLRSLFPIPAAVFVQTLVSMRNRALEMLKQGKTATTHTVVAVVGVIKSLPESTETLVQIESALHALIEKKLKRGSIPKTSYFFEVATALISAGLIGKSFWDNLHVAICDRAIREFGKAGPLYNVEWIVRQARLGLQSSPKKDFGTSITDIRKQICAELVNDKKKAADRLRLMKNASGTVRYLSTVFTKVTQGVEFQVDSNVSAAVIPQPRRRRIMNDVLETLVQELRSYSFETVAGQHPWFVEVEGEKHRACARHSKTSSSQRI